MPKNSEPPNDNDLLISIDATLKHLLAITALNYTAGKNQQAAIQSLAAAGIPAKAISDMTGWPTSTVAPVVSRTKAKSKGRTKSASSAGGATKAAGKT